MSNSEPQYFKGSELTTIQQKLLCKLVGPEKKWKLIYKATVNGTSASDFHSNCDKHSKTLTIIYANGFIFGGYTPCEFDSSGKNKFDKDTFLFSLVNPLKTKPMILHHKKRDPEVKSGSDKYIYSISCDKRFGPVFGGGWDINISENLKYENSCWTNLGHSFELSSFDFKFESDEIRNFFCNSYHFSPSEIEIFEEHIDDSS